jgi:hypothetical protein
MSLEGTNARIFICNRLSAVFVTSKETRHLSWMVLPSVKEKPSKKGAGSHGCSGSSPDRNHWNRSDTSLVCILLSAGNGDYRKMLLPQYFSCTGGFTKFGRPLFRGFGLPDPIRHKACIILIPAFIKHDVLDPTGDLQINL